MTTEIGKPRFHAAIQEKLEWFSVAHLSDHQIATIVTMHRNLAYALAESIPGHPQLTLALQHLIECKDGAVRALVAWRREHGNPPPPNEPDPELRTRSCPTCQSIGQPRLRVGGRWTDWELTGSTAGPHLDLCPDQWHQFYRADRLPPLGEPD